MVPVASIGIVKSIVDLRYQRVKMTSNFLTGECAHFAGIRHLVMRRVRDCVDMVDCHLQSLRKSCVNVFSKRRFNTNLKERGRV